MVQRVLLVDDCDNAAAQLLQIIENMPGFVVVGHARNGAEALRMFATLRPDVVCMDIVMPTLDGLQAARSILQAAPQTALYMISSVAEVPSKFAQAVAVGARDIIPKPFRPEEVRAMLLT